jgi:2-oxoglutarate ferredoxin oxidoreductase subunit gamma
MTMQTEIIIAGFGGQGVLFAGQMLSYAAMAAAKEVTWIPSYGPEMRGGTANCTVVIADEEIGSPFVHNPEAAIVLNLPSLDKYEPLVKPGGLLLINESMINRPAVRKDIRVVSFMGNEMAEELGDRRLMNMLMLGSLLANTKVLPMDIVERTVKEHLPARHQEMLKLNIAALHKGAEFIA